MFKGDPGRLGHAAQLLDGLGDVVLGWPQVGAGALDGLRETESGEPLEPFGVHVEAPFDDLSPGLADLPAH